MGDKGAPGTVSACTYTLNNGKELEECLKSLRWADEIVVLDSGSTDDTLEVARRHTSEVHHRDWTGFRDQLEHLGTLASGEWVLVVDADERVPEPLAEEIRRVVRGGSEETAYAVPRQTRYLGRWLRHGEFFPDYTLRLYRRGEAHYEGEPHARLVPRGRSGRLRHPIRHLGYDDLADQLETTRRYAVSAARELADAGCRRPLLQLLIRPPARWVRAYLWRLGFLDGVPGLVAAGMSAFYVFVKYAMVIELRRK
jgi:glycosyltransferase involved in cell wall biosynthesis